VRITLLVEKTLRLILNLVFNYRLTGDDSSSALFDCDENAQPLVVHYKRGSFDLVAIWTQSIAQQWHTATASKRDFTPVHFDGGSLSVLNSECDFGISISMTTTDANGVTQTISGIDEVRTTLPTALPANISIDINDGDSGAEILITGKQALSVEFGGNNSELLYLLCIDKADC
jgi:hypothetical protein